MTNHDRIILVTGATGQQGGAAARRLLATGWRVRALVRDPATPAAQRLTRAGAELAVGDMDDRDTLDAAARDVYGVFSVQPAHDDPRLADTEVRLGRNVADAAHAAGVRHLVYTSVGGADRAGGITHWDTKWDIERHIRGLGLPATILRPVMFMENHATPPWDVTSETALIKMIPPRATVQLIAVSDIGEFARLAFADPGHYLGRAIELAGDELTGEQLVAAISGAIGRTLQGAPAPSGDSAAGDSAVEPGSFGGWQADIPALRALHPGLMDFRTWLGREGEARFAALPTKPSAS